MAWQVPAEWLNALLEAGMGLQRLLLAATQALPGGQDAHGQPAWPWSWRLAAEPLWRDPGHARAVVYSTGALFVALLSCALALAWRRHRSLFMGLALAILVMAPWPDARHLFTPAEPTSFHRSTTGFSAASVAQGGQVYRTHCVTRHGSDARGHGTAVEQLAMWPPDLTGPLLWKRLEGELFWRIQHGMHDRHGRQTMPSFNHLITDHETWAVLDYLQALAAGTTLRLTGAWQSPVRLPSLSVQCRAGGSRPVNRLGGQTLKLVFLGQGMALPDEDPRLVTIVSGADPRQDTECRMNDGDAAQAFSLVLGVDRAQLSGHQVLVDRRGWMRAVSRPGRPDWSEDDLVCRSNAPASASLMGLGSSGLDGLLRRLDREPVRSVRGAFPH